VRALSHRRFVLRRCATCERELEVQPGLRLCRRCLRVAATVHAALEQDELTAARRRLVTVLLERAR